MQVIENMSRQLVLSARQITALCLGAKKAGYVPVIEIGGLLIRLVPIELAQQQSESDDDLEDWETFERRQETSSFDGFREPIPDALQNYYRKIGFDAATMTREDLRKLQARAEEDWKKELVTLPLNKRESGALTQLVAVGVGVPVHWSKIKNCACDTEERLITRGYIDTQKSKKFPDRTESYILTEAGYQAWESLSASRPSD